MTFKYTFNLSEPLNDQKDSFTKGTCMMLEMSFLDFKDIDTIYFLTCIACWNWMSPSSITITGTWCGTFFNISMITWEGNCYVHRIVSICPWWCNVAIWKTWICTKNYKQNTAIINCLEVTAVSQHLGKKNFYFYCFSLEW